MDALLFMIFAAIAVICGINLVVQTHPISSALSLVGVMGALAALIAYDMSRTGSFTLPGLAKMSVIKKAATKARKGINPFTKEPTIFKAKPARKVLKARPVKAAKDAL